MFDKIPIHKGEGVKNTFGEIEKKYFLFWKVPSKDNTPTTNGVSVNGVSNVMVTKASAIQEGGHP